MAFRGPNKTLAEVCLCTISARPRKSFLTRDVGGQKRKNKGSSRNGKEAARVSDTWSRALQIYNESNARVERIRSTLESQLGPSDDQSPKKRTKLQVDPTGKLQTPSDPDELRFPHFKTLVDMKSLLEFRMKKVGLLHDDSLPDDWFVVGPNENFTLDLSKVQFTPSKIMKILSRVCKGGSNCVGQGAIHFNLSHCFHFERTCVQKLLDLVGPTVQTLNLQGCPKLCDGDVELIMQGTPQLQNLDVTACSNYSPAVIGNLVLNHPNVANFKTLHISGLPGITEEIIDRVCAACPKLTSFEFGYCETLSVDCVKRVVKAFPNLTNLGIHWIDSVNDDVLAEITAGMPLLVRLNVDGCKSVSSGAIERLLARRAEGSFGELMTTAANGKVEALSTDRSSHGEFSLVDFLPGKPLNSQGCVSVGDIEASEVNRFSVLSCAFLNIPKPQLDLLRKTYPKVSITI